MDVEELVPTANLNTIRDGRGGIFTFIPNIISPIGKVIFYFISNHFFEGGLPS